jgi:hypothetical protein
MTDVRASKITVNSTKLQCFHVRKSVVFAGMLISYIIHVKEDSNKERAYRNGKCFLVAISIQRYAEAGCVKRIHSLLCRLCSMYPDDVRTLNLNALL